MEVHEPRGPGPGSMACPYPQSNYQFATVRQQLQLKITDKPYRRQQNHTLFFLVRENRAQFGALDFSKLGNKCHKAAISARFSTNLFQSLSTQTSTANPSIGRDYCSKVLVKSFFSFNSLLLLILKVFGFFTLSTGPWFRWLSVIEKLLLLAILFSESVRCLNALGIGHLTFASWWIRQPIKRRVSLPFFRARKTIFQYGVCNI